MPVELPGHDLSPLMPKPLYKNLTVQVLTAIALGVLVGWQFPRTGEQLKPLGDAFIALVKMVVAPIVFLTIVNGIGKMSDLRQAGRVGLKALAYFLTLTTFSLAIGMVVANVFKPGHGLPQHAAADSTVVGGTAAPSAKPQAGGEAAALPTGPSPFGTATQTATTHAASSPLTSSHLAASQPATRASSEDEQALAKYEKQAKEQTIVAFLLHLIPTTFVSAFTEGEMLQVLLVAILFGVALAQLGERVAPLLNGLESLAEVMFRIVAMLMKLAPIGAFGAMAFTIGKYGLASLGSLAGLMLCVYLTMALFIVLVLGGICMLVRVSLWKYLSFIREEILLVLGTSSSEAALPRMIEKLQRIGCGRSVVGMVIPAGYSFNLDGTAIYLSLAALFIAQAMGKPLALPEQIYMLAVLVVTSKGAAAVSGGGFITLAATLGTVQPALLPGLALILGVDRFMSEARAITNLIGNGVATIVVSKWEGEFDQGQYELAVRGQLPRDGSGT